MRRLTLAVSLLSLCVAATASGQTPDAFPSEPPRPGTPRDFKLPRRFTLDNGLQVTLVQWGTMPKARLTLRVRSGNAFEKPGEVWLADLTGDLLREGTPTRNATRISEEAARMGGALTVSVGPDVTSLGGEVLSEFAGRMVDLLADVAQHPAFPASELPRLKGNLARNLAVALSQPQQVALQKFREVLYKEHPCGRVFPTEAMIKGYTLEQVRGFYDSTYGAARSHLYIVGRFDGAAVEDAVKKAFADWARGAAPAVAPPKPASIRAVHIVDRLARCSPRSSSVCRRSIPRTRTSCRCG